MAVDRCICHNVPFTKIKALVAEGVPFTKVVADTRCGNGCGLCRPYVCAVLATGHTVLPVLSPEQCARFSAGVSWPEAPVPIPPATA